ncbi:hypothetical protein D3C78_1825850 [compost metagenome]
MIVLGLGDGGGGDPAAVVAGGVDGEPAPARADFQQVIIRPQCQSFADGPELGLLPLLQGGIRGRVDGAGILHVAVEKPLIEPVAEIVVRRDVDP